MNAWFLARISVIASPKKSIGDDPCLIYHFNKSQNQFETNHLELNDLNHLFRHWNTGFFGDSGVNAKTPQKISELSFPVEMWIWGNYLF